MYLVDTGLHFALRVSWVVLLIRHALHTSRPSARDGFGSSGSIVGRFEGQLQTLNNILQVSRSETTVVVIIIIVVVFIIITITMRATELINRFMMEFGWEALNCGFMIAQRTVWVFTGTYWQLRQTRKPENYARSAQVMNILGRFKFDDYLAPAKRSDFILTHNRFENPEIVLQDHITLYHVNEKEAVFVEAPVGAELWRARYSPFFMAAQYYNAVRVICMPIHSFYRLTEKLEDPKNLTFITNTARCGSTLLTQMFESTGKVVCLSEPSALNVMTKVAEDKEHKEGIDRLFRHTVRMLCKPTKNNEVGYVLKLTGPAMPRLDHIATLFPKSKSLFMYRDFLKVEQNIQQGSEQ